MPADTNTPRPHTKDNDKIFGVATKELRLLFERHPNPDLKAKIILWLVGLVFMPITLAGALIGYVRGYNRFMAVRDEEPVFSPLRRVVKLSMVIGAVLAWVMISIVTWAVMMVAVRDPSKLSLLAIYFGCNLLISAGVWFLFYRWKGGISNTLIEGRKFGSARFAWPEELEPYAYQDGNSSFSIGGDLFFKDKGHMLTVAGTRGGKGTNLIIPNLLGLGGYQGSWVVIDPKGENAAITARCQRDLGNEVIILNPWGLLEKQLGQAQSYNPLDILADADNVNLVDDAQMIAEMIVPIEKQATDRFFTDNARAVVAGLVLHLAVVQFEYAEDCALAKEDGQALPPVPPSRTLKTIWQWVRLPKKEWLQLLEDMTACCDLNYKEVVRQAANEIEKLMDAGDRTWGSIIATVLQCTDFIKSPALQASLETGLDPARLSGGKTTLYVIIPADKLHTHARWLRLVTTTTMRAVVRKPNKRVCFLLDEFSALGYLPEIETALSTYAGFEITVWPILQSLIQLKANYKDTWETFIGNSTIRTFFSINDNFTADYISKAIGQTSNVITKKGSKGIIEDAQANQRYLVTSDEVRRGSGQNIFAFTGANPVTYYPKRPYYEIPALNERADENPYVRK